MRSKIRCDGKSYKVLEFWVHLNKRLVTDVLIKKLQYIPQAAATAGTRCTRHLFPGVIDWSDFLLLQRSHLSNMQEAKHRTELLADMSSIPQWVMTRAILLYQTMHHTLRDDAGATFSSLCFLKGAERTRQAFPCFSSANHGCDYKLKSNLFRLG